MPIRLAIWLFLLAIAAYGVHAVGTDAARIRDVLAGLPVAALAGALVLTLSNALVRTLRWNYFLARLGYRLGRVIGSLAYIAGFAFTMTPGKSGEAARGFLLKDMGVRYSATIGLCVAERALDVLVVAALGCLLLGHYAGAWWIAAAAACALAAGFAMLAHPAPSAWLLRKGHSRIARRAQLLLRGLGDTLAAARGVLRHTPLVWGIALGACGWLLEATGVWFLFGAIGAELPWWLLVAIYSVSLLAGALSFLPGGLGGTEITMVALLVEAGVAPELAIAGTLAARACTLGFSVLMGMTSLLLFRLHTRAFASP